MKGSKSKSFFELVLFLFSGDSGNLRNIRVLKRNMIFVQSYDQEIPHRVLADSRTYELCGKVESVKTKQNYKNITAYVTYARAEEAAVAFLVELCLDRHFITCGRGLRCCSELCNTASISCVKPSAVTITVCLCTCGTGKIRLSSMTKLGKSSIRSIFKWQSNYSRKNNTYHLSTPYISTINPQRTT